MSKAALKKALRDIDRDGLAEIICEMYDARPEAREYLEFWVNPDADKELDKYKRKIFRILFISDGKPRKSRIHRYKDTHKILQFTLHRPGKDSRPHALRS
ncbi:MAG: hypothetical protein K2O56_06020 [Muribaculaceae bacterium]|nr:hypothetical protein [Muribaculaceae bacterium]